MSLLFVKLILAPLIVLIATLLGRRLGPRAAGVFVGLPGTAAPFLLTMYLMHGPVAATTTAAGGSAGQLICATYCIVIARTVRRLTRCSPASRRSASPSALVSPCFSSTMRMPRPSSS
ncbi:hypothetical protein [Nostocoides jenkinsii]|uniref:Uncharacterized protein n=1 Tax=Nostocoides jenkinsii Ben 74 TaxID=1193518 RepID=A0A077MFC6_9MICO|nr:hypothetical protein [Tetrasphaera jenkinsii]CCI53808.1 membrane hypothetical protein [Tetrasphaera jenkinsii Ben 74]